MDKQKLEIYMKNKAFIGTGYLIGDDKLAQALYGQLETYRLINDIDGETFDRLVKEVYDRIKDTIDVTIENSAHVVAFDAACRAAKGQPLAGGKHEG